jgi:hypothetical protein
MDLNNLRNLSRQGQNEMINRLPRECAPQKIAQELISKLQTNATEQAKKGGHKTGAFFDLWQETQSKGFSVNWESKKVGPLANFSDREELSKMLLKMVQEYVNDPNIKLRLEEYKYTSDTYRVYRNSIDATLEW